MENKHVEDEENTTKIVENQEEKEKENVKDGEEGEEEEEEEEEFFERESLLNQLADHIIPVFFTCGTYSSSVCVFVFPLIREKNILEDGDPETLFPILGMSDFHQASVDHIVTNGKYLLTGGDDEKINHFDMKQNEHLGIFQTFEGGVTCMESFGSQNHLLVGTENGMIILYQQMSKIGYQNIWKKECHKNGRVSDISVHPSHRCFVSVCNRKKLCLVNMMTGKIQFEMKMSNRCSRVQWWKYNTLLFIEGKRIRCFRFLQRESEHDTNTEDVMTPLFNYTHRFVISTVEIMNEFSIVTGDEKGRFQFWNYDGFNLDLTHEVENIHMGRIKGIKSVEINIMEYLITVVSDDGRISIWRLKQNEQLLKLQFLKRYKVRFVSLGVTFLRNINQIVKKDYYLFRKNQLKERYEQTGEGGEEEEEEKEKEEEEEEDEEKEREEIQESGNVKMDVSDE